ncbi:MAG TPA: DUF5996 family protein [Bryobacteraceae bacterium]|nr:DUF5996 family protein [Bryobacteraceae bacterium]
MTNPENWPALPLEEWKDTYRTLHMWSQIVGKIRMELSPPMNQWWHVTLYVNARGLTTGPIPYPRGIFEIQFDFLKHELEIVTSEGAKASRPLRAETVASFYKGVMREMESLAVHCEINPMPQEVPQPIPFDQDETPGFYDAEYARRHWQILVTSSKVFQKFRAEFCGKCSPVHFFWGSFDLACTRFSGRRAVPARKGVISGPAYSDEVCSAGFWPGGSGIDGPAYYSYAVPAPAGIEKERGWNAQLGEFLLMYDDVRRSESPEDTLYEFLERTYEAGARLGNWDRAALEIRSA